MSRHELGSYSAFPNLMQTLIQRITFNLGSPKLIDYHITFNLGSPKLIDYHCNHGHVPNAAICPLLKAVTYLNLNLLLYSLTFVHIQFKYICIRGCWEEAYQVR